MGCISCASRPREYIIADMDPVDAGSLEVGLIQIPFSKTIRLSYPTATFNPRADTVILRFQYQTVTYMQHWDRAAREAFITAVKFYNTDYETHNLPARAASRTARVYGSIKQMRVDWGALRVLINSRAFPRFDLGYAFNNNTPYFTVTQNSAENIFDSGVEEVELKCLQIIFYLTRSMAEDMAALFDRDYLLSLIVIPESPQRPLNSEIIPDEY